MLKFFLEYNLRLRLPFTTYMHGSIYLVMKTENRLYAKLTILVRNTTIFFVLMFSLTTLATLLFIPHMVARYKEVPWMFFIPVLAILAVANITRNITKRKYRWAFASSALVTALLMMMVAVGLFPNIVLSSLGAAHHLTIENASATSKSLGIMLTFAAVGVPFVATYTAFVFYTFRGKVQLDEQSY